MSTRSPSLVEGQLDRRSLGSVDGFQHIDMTCSSRLAWRQPHDLQIVDEHANSVLDSKVVGDLARDWHNRERKVIAIEQDLAFRAKKLRDHERASTDRAIAEAHGRPRVRDRRA